jgi:ubiquinone/menaquinone biosynthesis C-methylase UbiE
MNGNTNQNDPTIYYYDADYPSPHSSIYPENFDEITNYQGLAHDIARYKEIAETQGKAVLEVCCGSGRVAIPLAKSGFAVTAVDISEGLLDQFKKKLSCESAEVRTKVKLVHQDATTLNLETKNFDSVIVAFNSLLCIPDFEGQCKTLSAIANHLSPKGKLMLDIVNPLLLKFDGDATPKAFYTRRNPHNGNTFTRFSMRGAFDENHRQKLYGWYDEILPDGAVARQHYSMYWRPIFRFEIELMLSQAGLKIALLEGGHNKETFTAQSPHMFIQAIKV